MNAKQWLEESIEGGSMSAKELLSFILQYTTNEDIETFWGLDMDEIDPDLCDTCGEELDAFGDCPTCDNGVCEECGNPLNSDGQCDVCSADLCEYCEEPLDSDGDCANPYCNGLDHDDDDEIDYMEDSPAPLDPPLDTVVYPNLQDIIHALDEQGCYYDGHTLTRRVLRGPDDSLLHVASSYGISEADLWAEYALICLRAGFYHGAFSHLDSTALNGEPANNAPSGPSWSVYKDVFGWFVNTFDEPIHTIKLTNGVMTTITYILDFETDTYFEVIDQANPHWLLHFPKEYWSRG